MPRPLRNTVLAAALSAVLVAGCGGGGNNETDQIKQTVDAVFLSHNVSACTQNVTPRFLKATYGKDPKKAVAACEKSQAQTSKAADTLSFLGVRVKDKTAVATVKITGGSLNGRTLTAVLVNNKGWKFDTLVPQQAPPSDAEVRKTVEGAFKQGLITQGMAPKQASCFVAYLRKKVSDAQLAQDLEALKSHQTVPDFTAATASCKS